MTCFALFAAGGVQTLRAQAHDTVWVWNAQCPHPTMIDVRIRLDSATIYRNTIPICQWERQFEAGRATVHFTARRPLVWYGYQTAGDASRPDPGDTTAANTPFEIDLWQAGGETDAIEVGFTAMARDTLHMNGLHLLLPTKFSASEMASGLTLETSPAPAPPNGSHGKP